MTSAAYYERYIEITMMLKPRQHMSTMTTKLVYLETIAFLDFFESFGGYRQQQVPISSKERSSQKCGAVSIIVIILTNGN